MRLQICDVAEGSTHLDCLSVERGFGAPRGPFLPPIRRWYRSDRRRASGRRVASLLAVLTGNTGAPATPIALITARRDIRHRVLTNANWCRVTPGKQPSKRCSKGAIRCLDISAVH